MQIRPVVILEIIVSLMSFSNLLYSATYHVSQISCASDKNPGTESSPFLTISHAAQTAQPGDTVIVHEGIYREWVRPVRGGNDSNSMITYQAAEGEKVYIRGSEVFNPTWEPVIKNDSKFKDQILSAYNKYDHFLQAKLPDKFWQSHPRTNKIYNPFRIGLRMGWYSPPEERLQEKDANNLNALVVGEVFLQGKPLKQVRTVEECKANRGTYAVSPDGKTLYVFFMPFSKGPVEITVRERVFAPEIRGLGYIKVKGFIMEQAANQGQLPQSGMVSTRSGNNWTIEDNVIRYASTIGLDVGSETDTSNRCLSKGDINEGPWKTGLGVPSYESRLLPGRKYNEGHNLTRAPKRSRNHIIRNNIISDNGLTGLAAINASDLLVEKNIIQNNNRRYLYPTENLDLEWCETAGIKFLICANTVIQHNLVRNNYGEARGIWIDNNNDHCKVLNNLIINNQYGIDMEINTVENIVEGNIIAFSRMDGLSCRESKNLVFAHNLVMYSGRWGCSLRFTPIRGNYFDRIFDSVSNCKVVNNIIIGSQEGALRIPLPAGLNVNNFVAGNLISTPQKFQIERTPMASTPFELMLSVAEKRFKEANLPGKFWPNFAEWKKQDAYVAGFCGFEAFNVFVQGQENIYTKLNNPLIFETMDSFATDGLVRQWPNENSMLGVEPGYKLKLNFPEVSKVKRYDGYISDYFGQRVDSEMVVPGPIQNLDDSELIIW